MGSISGNVGATCKECKCRFNYQINDDWIFIDMEVTGTCDNCFNKKSHDCVDEYSLMGENESFEIVGKKEFTKEETALRKKEIDNAEPVM